MPKQWLAIKAFERDEEVLKTLQLNEDIKKRIENHIIASETALDDDAESIITGERYVYIGNIVSKTVKKAKKGQDITSDKIDKIVTNRILVFPIFARIMWAVYYISVISAYSSMAFNMLCAPCFAAIGAIRREMGSAKQTWIAVGFQTLTAYLVSLLINKVGCAIFLGGSIMEAVIAIAIVVTLTIGKSKKQVSIQTRLEG